MWDPSTGEPLHRALVWQDRRTAARCDELRVHGHEAMVRTRTGLVLDPYFSGTKVEWLLRHVDGLRERAESGRAVFGTIDSWLVFNLCGEHVTDPSNASRTLLYDIGRGAWDDELCALFGVPRRALPEVRPSIGTFGTTRPEALHGHAVPVAGIAGDQQAALYGQACLDPGQGKSTYGTGSFVLLNSGAAPPIAPPGLLTTVAWGIGAAHAVRAGGVDLRHRRGGAVAARRPGHHPRGGGDRGAGGVARVQRRRLLRPGADRAGLAALGSLRARARSSG